MDAILLVGGQGTRLRPLTYTTPKPMLPVAGVPFVAHQVARLRAVGVDHVVLATSYKPEVFRSHFGAEVDYVTETQPLGTGGGIRNVVERLRADTDEPIVVLNGDVLSDHDITAQVEMHRSTGAAVTLHLTVVDDARAFGCVPTESDGRVVAFLEKSPEPVTSQINAGCYVFRRSVIDAIPAARPVSVERETFPGLLDAGERLQGYVEQAYWLDIGTPAAYLQACRDFVLGRVSSPAVTLRPGEALVLDGAQVSVDARVVNGSTVGHGAVVSPGAVIDGSVLLDRAFVGPGARVTDCVVDAGARVDEAAVIAGAVVGA